MTASWYYRSGNEDVGPLSAQQLRQKAESGFVRPHTLVRKGPTGTWLLAIRVVGLFPASQEGSAVHAAAPAVGQDAAPTQALPSVHPVSSPWSHPEDAPADTQPRTAALRSRLVERAGRIRSFCVGHSGTISIVAALSLPLMATLVGFWWMRSGVLDEPSATMIAAKGRAGTSPRSPASASVVESSRSPIATVENRAHGPVSAPAGPPQSVVPEHESQSPRAQPVAAAAPVAPATAVPAPVAVTVARPKDSMPNTAAAPKEKPRVAEAAAGDPPEAEHAATPPAAKPRNAKHLADNAEDAEFQDPWPEQLQSVLTKQAALREKWTELKGQEEQLAAAMQDMQMKISLAADRMRAIQMEAQSIRSAINGQQQRSGTRFGDSPQLVALNNQYQMLLTQSQAGQAEINGLQSRAEQVKAKSVGLIEAADQASVDWFTLCDALGRRGEAAHRGTIAAMGKWISREPQLPLPRLARGFSYLHTGDFDEAAQDFQEVARLDPRKAALASLGRGCVLAKQGKGKAAGTAYNEAARLAKAQENRDNQTLAAVNLFHGYMAMNQQNYPVALQDFALAVKFAKDFPEAQQAYAWLLATCPRETIRNKAKAVECAQIAWKRASGGRWDFAETLAAAHASAGDFDAAIDWAKKAVYMAPKESKSVARQRLQLYESHVPYRLGGEP